MGRMWGASRSPTSRNGWSLVRRESGRSGRGLFVESEHLQPSLQQLLAGRGPQVAVPSGPSGPRYAGPIPRPVVPFSKPARFARIDSSHASSERWWGRITWALSLRMMVPCKACFSCTSKISHLQLKRVDDHARPGDADDPGAQHPDRQLVQHEAGVAELDAMSGVRPAAGATTYLARSASTSVIFPFASSPNCAPITAVTVIRYPVSPNAGVEGGCAERTVREGGGPVGMFRRPARAGRPLNPSSLA